MANRLPPTRVDPELDRQRAITEAERPQVLDLVADHQHAGVQQLVHHRRPGEQEVHPGLLEVVHEGRVVDVSLGVEVAPANRTLRRDKAARGLQSHP